MRAYFLVCLSPFGAADPAQRALTLARHRMQRSLEANEENSGFPDRERDFDGPVAVTKITRGA